MSDRADGPDHQDHPRLPPVAYPLLGLVFGGILVFSFSRVLLAVKKDVAPVIALLMALNVLVGAALVAYGRRVRRRPVSFPLLVGAALAVIAIGFVALTLEPTGVSEATGGGAQPVEIKLVAKDTAFDRTDLQMPEGAGVTIAFDNQDSGVPHNFAMFSDPAATQVVFRGDVITGPKTTNYSFSAPEAGTYYFHCDVHPTQMKGTVTVGPTTGGGGEGPPGGQPGGGGAAGGAPVTAKGLAFQPTQVTVPGGGKITLHFDNQDAGTPHNIHVFEGSDASAPSLFMGELVTGPATKDYSFPAPPPGTYFFHCDVHPQQMTGTLIVR